MDSIHQKLAFIEHLMQARPCAKPTQEKPTEVKRICVQEMWLRQGCWEEIVLTVQLGPKCITCILEDRQMEGETDREANLSLFWRQKREMQPQARLPTRHREWEEERKELFSEPPRHIQSCWHLHFRSRKLTSDSDFQNCQRIDFCFLNPPSCGHLLQWQGTTLWISLKCEK